MQSIEQYGFCLIPSASTFEEHYLQTKANIETLCRIAEQLSRQFNVRNTNLAYRFGPNLFLTINLKDGEAAFGIYDGNKNKLHNEYPADSFQHFTTKSFSNFGIRCYKTIQSLSEGETYNLGKLNEAWENYWNNMFESQNASARRGNI